MELTLNNTLAYIQFKAAKMLCRNKQHFLPPANKAAFLIVNVEAAFILCLQVAHAPPALQL